MKKGVFIYGLTDVKSISKPTGVDKKVLAQIHAINACRTELINIFTPKENHGFLVQIRKLLGGIFHLLDVFQKFKIFLKKMSNVFFFVFLLDIDWTILYLDIIKCSMAMIFSTSEGW